MANDDMKDQHEDGADSESTEGRPVEAPETVSKEVTSAKRGGAEGGLPRTAVIVVVALLAGAAGGWFAKEAHAKTSRAAVAQEDGGSCATWEQQICEGVGAQARACLEAKAASGLLPQAACATALEAVPDTIAKVTAARQVCTTLVDKLCQEIGAESATCSMVREQTEMFPPERCQDMLDNYEQIAGQLRQMHEQMGGGHPHGGPQPGSASPPGAIPVPPQ